MSPARALGLVIAVVAVAPALALAQAPIPAQPAVPAPPAVVATPIVVAPAPAAPAPVVNPADGECVTTTTTTTRCTGAAAPYAAHPAPPTVIVPAPVLPRLDNELPPPRVVPCVLPPGWTLQQDPDGSLWRVKHHRGNPSLWAPGLVLWMASYVGGVFGSFVWGDGYGPAPEVSFPIVGAFVASGLTDSSGGKVGWALDGVAQLGGFIMFVAGASMQGKIERLPVTIAPTSFYGGGGGVALTGRF